MKPRDFRQIRRGRHTTRHAELFLMKAYLVDTPGFSSLDLFAAGITEELLVQSYPEIWALQMTPAGFYLAST